MLNQHLSASLFGGGSGSRTPTNSSSNSNSNSNSNTSAFMNTSSPSRRSPAATAAATTTTTAAQSPDDNDNDHHPAIDAAATTDDNDHDHNNNNNNEGAGNDVTHYDSTAATITGYVDNNNTIDNAATPAGDADVDADEISGGVGIKIATRSTSGINDVATAAAAAAAATTAVTATAPLAAPLVPTTTERISAADIAIAGAIGAASMLQHQVCDNLLPRLEHEIKQTLVPKVVSALKQQQHQQHHTIFNKGSSSNSNEQDAQKAKKKKSLVRQRTTTAAAANNNDTISKYHPPVTTDIVYLTDRFLVSSIPAVGSIYFNDTTGPSFLDTGRDAVVKEQKPLMFTSPSRNHHHHRRQQQQQQHRRRRDNNISNTDSIDSDDGDDDNNNAEILITRVSEEELASSPDHHYHRPIIIEDTTVNGDNPQEGGSSSPAVNAVVASVETTSNNAHANATTTTTHTHDAESNDDDDDDDDNEVPPLMMQNRNNTTQNTTTSINSSCNDNAKDEANEEEKIVTEEDNNNIKIRIDSSGNDDDADNYDDISAIDTTTTTTTTNIDRIDKSNDTKNDRNNNKCTELDVTGTKPGNSVITEDLIVVSPAKKKESEKELTYSEVVEDEDSDLSFSTAVGEGNEDENDEEFEDANTAITAATAANQHDDDDVASVGSSPLLSFPAVVAQDEEESTSLALSATTEIVVQSQSISSLQRVDTTTNLILDAVPTSSTSASVGAEPAGGSDSDDGISSSQSAVLNEDDAKKMIGNSSNNNDKIIEFSSPASSLLDGETKDQKEGTEEKDYHIQKLLATPTKTTTRPIINHNDVADNDDILPQQQQNQSSPIVKNISSIQRRSNLIDRNDINDKEEGEESMSSEIFTVPYNDVVDVHNNNNNNNNNNIIDESENDDTTKINNTIEEQRQRNKSAQPIVNSPGTMVTYLDNVHGKDRYLAISLAKEKPDDRTLLLFRRQIVTMGTGSDWNPCCVERSETPSIPHILKVCYAVHSFLQLDPKNVVLTYCDNGKTRTAIAAACYLKFTNMVPRTEDGFRYFLLQLRRHKQLRTEREKKRTQIMGPILSAAYDAFDNVDDADNEERMIAIVNNIINQIPPSLRLFFRQFDKVLSLGGFLNHRPLLLRAVAIQGIPLEDQPCLDIWDSSQRHVYSSHHPILLQPPATPNSTIATLGEENDTFNNKPVSQWIDEEGFYQINTVLDGEFLILCRFGGDFADDTNGSSNTMIHDPSKVLFRYTNTTGFLAGGSIYDLPSKKVDLMRQYSDHLDDEDFLFSLVFEADWEHIEDGEDDEDDNYKRISPAMRKKLKSTSEKCGERIWRCHEEEARDEGWKAIYDLHSAHPTHEDISSFRRFYGNRRIPDINLCPDHLITLSLQLSNYDFQRCTVLLLDSPVFSWWLDSISSSSMSPGEKKNEKLVQPKNQHNFEENTDEEYVNDNNNRKKSFKEIEAEATKSIFDILDSVDVSSTLNPTDMQHIHEWEKRKPKRLESQMLSQPTQKDEIVSNEDRRRSLSGVCLKETGFMIPSIMYPRRGDVVRSFNLHSNCIPPGSQQTKRDQPSSPNLSIPQPRMPYFPHNGPKLLPSPSPHLQKKGGFDKFEGYPIPVYDPKLEAAKEIHMQLRHTGVTLQDLIELEQASKGWTGRREDNNKTKSSEATSSNPNPPTDEKDPSEDMALSERKELSMNRKKKEEKENKWQEDTEAKAEEKRKAMEEKKKILHEKVAATEQEMKKAKQPKKPTDRPKSILGADEKEEKPLKDDCEYKKYFKMLKMGMAREQVLHAMKRDERDPNIIDFDPNKSLKSQLGQLSGPSADESSNNEDGPLKSDPILGADEKEEGINEEEVPLKDDVDYKKYFKMKSIMMPLGAIKNALVRDGRDPNIIDFDPNKSLKSQLGQPSGPSADEGINNEEVPLKDDVDYKKYFKMKSIMMPLGAIKNALVRDGRDPNIIDFDPNKSLKSQLGQSSGSSADEGINNEEVPLKDDVDYKKYFKMKSIMMPLGAIKNALVRDGRDPNIIDLNPNKSLKSQMGNVHKIKVTKKERKKNVRRKKIFWNPIDSNKLQKDSLWNIVQDHVRMSNIDYDQKEFEELFTESAEPSSRKKKEIVKKVAKKAVQAIDPKRSMNGGIVLSRLKTDHQKIAVYVDRMEHNKFDGTQLKNLKEYLPTADERRSLIAYMSKGATSEEKQKELYNDLSETEKYMFTLMDVSDANAKLHTMGFRSGFKNRFADLTSSVRTLNSACDELRSSDKLRKLMAMILTVVNQINTGGEGNLATGFTLDALLKLNEAKAFDKKTSVLHYVVKLVKKNDETLLSFQIDLGHVIPAESVLLDTVVGDIKGIENELEDVVEIVSKEAERLEKAGELPKPTLADLVEQKSVVQHVGCVPQFNKISHLTGRTSMERFALNAKVLCEQTVESIENVKGKYSLLLGYFGEDENMATGDFFGILRRFMAEWKKAVNVVEKIERAQAKEKKREERRAAKEKKSKTSTKYISTVTKSAGPGGISAFIGPGGAAALAKAAAKLKTQDKSTVPTNKPQLSGMPVPTAQATQKKMEPVTQSLDTDHKQPPLAAEAAIKRSTKEESSSPPKGSVTTNVAPASANKPGKIDLNKFATLSIPGMGGGPPTKIIASDLSINSEKKKKPGKIDLNAFATLSIPGMGGGPPTKVIASDLSINSEMKKKSSTVAATLTNKPGKIDVNAFATLNIPGMSDGPPTKIIASDLSINSEKKKESSTIADASTNKPRRINMNEFANLSIPGMSDGPLTKIIVSDLSINSEKKKESSTVADASTNKSGKINMNEFANLSIPGMGDGSPGGGGLKIIATNASSIKSEEKNESVHKNSSPQFMNSSSSFERSAGAGITSLLNHPALEKSARQDSQKETEEHFSASEKVELKSNGEMGEKASISYENNNGPILVQNNDMHDMPSRSSATKVQKENNSPISMPSLENFLEMKGSPSNQELRNEIIHRNCDDSSVPVMVVENLDESSGKGKDSNDGTITWDNSEGNGISDYMGWANQAIRLSDTESVRGFEASRHIVDNNDDESTIATNFDDDASIATEVMATPRNHDYHDSDNDFYNSINNYNGSYTNDPYSSNQYSGDNQTNDSVINMPVSFNHDAGEEFGASLSFGDGGGFNDSAEINTSFNGNDIYGVNNDDLGRFGRDPYGFGSPTELLSPTTTAGNPDRPWGASSRIGTGSGDGGKSSDNGTDLNKPWATATTPEGNNINKSDQQEQSNKTKGWFSALRGGR